MLSGYDGRGNLVVDVTESFGKIRQNLPDGNLLQRFMKIQLIMKYSSI